MNGIQEKTMAAALAISASPNELKTLLEGEFFPVVPHFFVGWFDLLHLSMFGFFFSFFFFFFSPFPLPGKSLFKSLLKVP